MNKQRDRATHGHQGGGGYAVSYRLRPAASDGPTTIVRMCIVGLPLVGRPQTNRNILTSFRAIFGPKPFGRGMIGRGMAGSERAHLSFSGSPRAGVPVPGWAFRRAEAGDRSQLAGRGPEAVRQR
jgi:hypothetical protein